MSWDPDLKTDLNFVSTQSFMEISKGVIVYTNWNMKTIARLTVIKISHDDAGENTKCKIIEII